VTENVDRALREARETIGTPRRALSVIPCRGHRGSVDITGPDPLADPVHVSAADWAEFLAAAKAGRFDDL
jgi:hypothetical protein